MQKLESTEQKRVIGLDFDDVLLDCNTSLCQFIGEVYDYRYTFEEHHTWHLHVLWRCSEDEATRRIHEWLHSEYHHKTSPIPGALDGVAQLIRRGYELHIITSRTPEMREATLNWLQENFPPQSFKEVHFVGRGIPGNGNKSEVCHQLGTSYMVDDSPIHAPEMVQSGVNVILFDAPWNRSASFPRPIPRACGWEDVLRIVG